MFDIGWSELVVIAVVALIAIGPKELPGVLRMIGQWMGKARKMAAEFQGQFQEAMREAEMADLKKSFDEVKEAVSLSQPSADTSMPAIASLRCQLRPSRDEAKPIRRSLIGHDLYNTVRTWTLQLCKCHFRYFPLSFLL